MQLVLFKVKPGVTPAQLAEWSAKGAAMVGKIPGKPLAAHSLGLR